MPSKASLKYVLPVLVVGLLLCTQAIAKTSSPTKRSVQVSVHNQTAGISNQLDETDLEQVRTELLNFVISYKEFASGVGMQKEAASLEKSEAQIRAFSLKQLEVFKNVFQDVSGMMGATQKLRGAVQTMRAASTTSFSKVRGSIGPNTAGLPGADYPSCGSTRTDETVIDASDVALFVAEGVREAAGRACDEVIVILGEGGNGSLVCIATDAIYIAAKAVNFGLHFCDDKIDQAELGATYGRLGHIHGDLEASVANDNTNKTAVINNDNANMTSIINNDDANKTTIINNDNANTAALTTTVNANTASIIANDNANTAAVIANDNANKNELRDLILRTQIEADLAQPDSSTPVAVFVTPTANGGYLNLVRAIVAQTMANVLAAGGKVGQAQSLLAQGDAAKTAGDFKGAYFLYRKAYQAAVR
jgi:hypothetical protein